MRRLSDRAIDRLKAVGDLPDLSGTKYRLVEPIPLSRRRAREEAVGLRW